MYFESFFLTCLAHASYMIASDGLAAVVDPQRDVQIYIDEAKKQGFRIVAVIETHLHADFVSGHRELAERTGAEIWISAKAGAKFPHRAMHDGDKITIGRCVFTCLETPGHTPESMCITVTDLDKSMNPFAVLTGDTLFIGDVGRPDLSPDYTSKQLAGMLYDSLHNKLFLLRDDVQVYPAHGAGSLCGRNISSERSSTIGKEKQFNYALQPMSRDAFIELLTAELPERPGYFARDAEINREGAEGIEELAPLAALPPSEVERMAFTPGATAIVLDTRPSNDFFAGHIPGSLHIALSGEYASWAGAIIGLDRPIILVAEDPERLEESRLRLARVGIEKVLGYLEGGIEAWQASGRAMTQSTQVTAGELNNLLASDAGIQVVDVRRPAEWWDGHIAQARLATLNQFAALLTTDGAGAKKFLGDLDPARPVVLHCKSGYRSAIATSLMERAGFPTVVNLIGGFDAWKALKLPATAGATAPAEKAVS